MGNKSISPKNTRRVMKTREVADLLGCHPETIRRRTKEGRFVQPIVLSRSGYGYWSDEVDQWLEEQRS